MGILGKNQFFDRKSAMSGVFHFLPQKLVGNDGGAG